MGSDWILHVKEYAKKHNCSYRDAMKKAGSTYKSGRGQALLLAPGLGQNNVKWGSGRKKKGGWVNP